MQNTFHTSMGTALSVYIHTTPLIMSGIVDLVGQSNGLIPLLHNSQMLQSEANRGTCSHWVSVHILSVSNTLCLLEGGSTLLSPSSCVPPKQKSIFPLLVSCSIFPLSIGRTLGQKPKPKPKPKLSNSLQHCLFIRLFFYFLFNKEFIPSQTRNTLPF